jgi:enamine deaminase RidA (YjgF/YER057c/UK114 family)
MSVTGSNPERQEFGFDGPAPVPISLAVPAGDFVFVSGLSDHFFKPEEVSFDASGEVIDDGRRFKRFRGFNNAYKEAFTRTRPTRAILRNEFMFKTRIEIKVVAYKPTSSAGSS